MHLKLFCNCNEEKQEILKTFQDTVLAVIQSVEKTNNTFYEMAAKIETEHFKQLEKSADKQFVMMATQNDKFLSFLREKNEQKMKEEEITRIVPEEPNSIEKETQEEDPLAELSPADFDNVKNFQFEGEETIYPVTME